VSGYQQFFAEMKRRRVFRVMAVYGVIGFGVIEAAGADQQEAPTTPLSYSAPRTGAPPTIDGRLDDAVWAGAPATEAFIDIRGGDHSEPTWPTHARMLWDDTHLYVGAWLEEPHLWGTLTERDAIIYHDHDFEVFLDPDGDGEAYFEIEINVLGTEFDLFLDRAYNKGGQADIAWDLDGLRTAVFADGTINDASDTDRGWGVEMAIPWAGLVSPDGSVVTAPPSIGDVWRVNFSRVQWPLNHLETGGYERAAEVSFDVHEEDNWVWSPQGEINMHIPEMWGLVHFVEGGTP
jgi:hypothetical protein